jgi:hypothetical protein
MPTMYWLILMGSFYLPTFKACCLNILRSGVLIIALLSGVVGPNQSVILFDPQAQSYVNCSRSAMLTLTISLDRQAKDTGFWDGGSAEIRAWQEAHKCNELCTRLKLKASRGPLRIGFSQTR